jgi:uncharacterized protein (DUF885 family)
MTLADIVIEVDRYIADPGQALGYKVGQLEIARLRREAEAALGPRFDVRQFHRLMLVNGVLPLGALGTQVREWTATAAAAR